MNKLKTSQAKSNKLSRGRGAFRRASFFAFFLSAVSLLVFSLPLYSQTELGSEDDLTVLGVNGTALDPDTEIKGFTVFGSTQAAYTGAAAGPGNVVVNGVLAVSSGAYFVANSTLAGGAYMAGVTSFTNVGNIFITGGADNQVLAKNGNAGPLKWTAVSALGDNLGSHTATQNLNLDSFNLVGISSVNFRSNVYITSAAAAQHGGVYVSSNLFVAGISSATAYYGDGSRLTGVSTDTLKIGDSYGGGIVFWVDEKSGRALISAAADYGSGILWADDGSFTGASAEGIFAGRSNTVLISTTLGSGVNSAALRCQNYTATVSGVYYDDWYLPSRDEARLLYEQKDVVGGFGATAYWTSVESPPGSAWRKHFGSGSEDVIPKGFAYSVRCVRGSPFSAFDSLLNAETVRNGAYISSTQTFTGGNTFLNGVTAAQLSLANNVSISSEAGAALGAGVRVSTNVYIVGFSSATRYYGDGSSLTGLSGLSDNLGNHTATQNLNLNTFNLINVGSITANAAITTYSSMTVAGNAFSVGGSTLAVAAGKVGIGQATADQRLTVNGNISQTGVLISSGAGNNYFAGKVGIGTTTPTALLHLATPGGFVAGASTYYDFIVNSGRTTGGGPITVYGVYSTPFADNGTNYGVYSAPTGGGPIYPGIFMNGNVGIGNSAPTSRLYVEDNSASPAQEVKQNGSGKLLVLKSGAADAFTVSNVGNVGIGVAVATGDLDVTQNKTIGGMSTWYNLKLASSYTSGGLPNSLTVYGLYAAPTNNDTSITYGVYSSPTSNAGKSYGIYSDPKGSGTIYSAILMGGNVGISTGVPQARLDVLAGGSAQTDMAQIWRDGTGAIKSSMSATGVMMAAKFIGDGSGITGIGGNDNLGNHTATQNLGMAGFDIVNASSITVAASKPGLTISTNLYVMNGNVGIGTAPANGYKLEVGYGDALINQVRVGQGPTLISNPDQRNIVLGNGAGAALAAGSYRNYLIGAGAGQSVTTGGDNVIISNTSGSSTLANTVVVGMNANGGGGASVVLGALAGQSTSAQDQVLVGYAAGRLGVGGPGAIAVGYQALLNNAGANNIAIGKNAGSGITSGANNVILGGNTGSGIAASNGNILIADGAGILRMQVDGNGNVGISTGAPQARLDVLAAGSAQTDMAQLWRDGGGNIKSSMSATGVMMAVKFVGDGSGITGIGGNDNLGNHTATQNLAMNTFNIVNIGSITANAAITTYSSMTVAGNGGIYGLSVSSNITAAGGAFNTINGNVGIGTAVPRAKLEVVGASRVTSDGSSTRYAEETVFERTLPAAQDSYVEIGKFNTVGAQREVNFEVDLNGFNGSGGHSKKYVIVANYDDIQGIGWKEVLPLYNTGERGGEYTLDIGGTAVTSGAELTLRLRTTRVLPAPEVILARVKAVGPSLAASLSGTGTGASVTGLLRQAGLTQVQGNVGIGVVTPGARLDIVSTGTTVNDYAQIWRDSGGIIKSSVSATGVMMATKFVGDGSGITGIGGNDNLGNHTATLNLNMSGKDIVSVSTISVSSLTTTAAGIVVSTNLYVVKGNVGIGTGSPASLLEVKGVPNTATLRLNVPYSAANQYNSLAFTNSALIESEIRTISDTNWGAHLALLTKPNDGDPGTPATERLRITSAGAVGIGTTTTLAALHVVSTGPALTQMAQVWGNTSGAIVSSISATGVMTAVKFVGDGSGITGIGGNDNLGNHTATQDLNMNSKAIVGISTIATSGIYISSYGVIQTTGPGLGNIAGNARGAGAVDLQNYRAAAGNVASGAYSVIAGGSSQTSSGPGSVAVGGASNTSAGSSSFVGAGYLNTANNNYSAVVAGENNTASGAASAVPGGAYNTALGQYSFAAGYYSSSTANGTFTWSDSLGQINNNAVQNRTLFKNAGGFLITGSTNTNMTALLNRGVFVTGNGLVGISTGVPYAALDVVSSGTATNIYAQIWRNSSGVEVASLTSQGTLYATLANAGDGLGGHVATQNLIMSSFSLVSISSANFRPGVFITSASLAQYGGLYLSSHVYLSNGSSLYNVSSVTASGSLTAFLVQADSASFTTTAGTGLAVSSSAYLATAGGNVGVGTAAVSGSKLYVVSGTGPQMTLSYGAGKSADFKVASDGNLSIGPVSSSLTTTIGSAAEALRVDASGKVGIGTSNPTSALQVVGLPVYANNAAAIAGGLTAGAFYRTGGDPDLVAVVH